MKKNFIFYFIILFYFVLNINVLSELKASERRPSFSRVKRRITKNKKNRLKKSRVKRAISSSQKSIIKENLSIIKRPLSETNSIVQKKEALIKTVTDLGKVAIQQNHPVRTSIIVNALLKDDKSIGKDTVGNIIDTESGKTIIEKTEIEDLENKISDPKVLNRISSEENNEEYLLEEPDSNTPININIEKFLFKNLEITSENLLNYLFHAMIAIRPFNDGLIDILGLLYTYDESSFTIDGENYLYNNEITLKKIILDNKEYKKIKVHVDNYFTAIKKIESIEADEDITFNTKANKNKEIKDIMALIKNEIAPLSFDKKLEKILFYILGVYLYCHFNKEGNETINEYAKNYFYSFLLKNTKIITDTINNFNEKIFISVIQNLNTLNIKTILEKENFLFTHNTEYTQIAIFNIMYQILSNLLNINDIDINEAIKSIISKIINEAKNNDNIEEAKEKLIENIKKYYNNITKIIQFINLNNDLKNMLYNKEYQIYIPHVKELLLPEIKGSKNIKCFDLIRNINSYEVINYLREDNAEDKDNSNIINLYNFEIKTDKDIYKNKLFENLLISKTINNEADQKEPIENQYQSNIKTVIEYIINFEKYQNYNNENEDIDNLLYLLKNIINLDYFFKKKITEIAEIKNSETLLQYYNYLKTTNTLFLKYIQAIFKKLKEQRKDLANFDFKASQRILNSVYEKAIPVALTTGVLGATYLIGPENIAKGTGAIFGGLFNQIAENPKTAAGITLLVGAGYGLKKFWNKTVNKEKDKQEKIENLESVDELEALNT